MALVAFVALAMACSAGHGGPQADREKQPAAESQPAKVAGTQLRAIRVAVFDFDVLKGVDVEGGALTDRINAMLAAIPKVTIVNRDQIKRVAEEHKIALSGLVDSATAVRLGKFLSAQYIVVGRASRIGPAQYLVAKIVDVETTVQDTISTKASVEDGPGRLIDRLAARLGEAVRRLQLPLEVDAGAAALARLRAALKPLAGKAILVAVAERHVQRPLRDPAAQMTLTKRLQRLGFKVVVPKDPRAGWKEALLMTGKFADKKVDYLLEGEGISAFAAQIHGLVSCRARVELRLIAVPGKTVTVGDKGVAARVDLVEALAAKAALEDAATEACDAVLKRLAKTLAKAKEKDAEAAPARGEWTP